MELNFVNIIRVVNWFFYIIIPTSEILTFIKESYYSLNGKVRIFLKKYPQVQVLFWVLVSFNFIDLLLIQPFGWAFTWFWSVAYVFTLLITLFKAFGKYKSKMSYKAFIKKFVDMLICGIFFCGIVALFTKLPVSEYIAFELSFILVMIVLTYIDQRQYIPRRERVQSDSVLVMLVS